MYFSRKNRYLKWWITDFSSLFQQPAYPRSLWNAVNLPITAPYHWYRLAWCDQEVFLSEQTDFLQDIPANTDIFLAFKTQFKNVQNRFFRHDETFPGYLSNPL